MTDKRLLIIAHAPSPNTVRLRDAVAAGAQDDDISGVAVDVRGPFDTEPEHVTGSSGILLFTTENLGYMSGAMKDFFDRCYYPCLEETQGMPYALIVRAGHDGTGTRRAVETITTGLRWKPVAAPLICRGGFDEEFVDQCRELGTMMAAGIEAGVF
ncbi:MAG: flavodoxin family protein [Alphaproteobacteria bacterium]|nr:flavodoxin family protein [Alphaproteobacteria bacterium]